MVDPIAARVNETGVVPTPNIDITVRAAYRAVKDLCKPDVLYDLKFDDNDNEGSRSVFKRFARTLPVEVWLVALPVDQQGAARHDEQPVVCPMAFKLRLKVELEGLQAQLVDELSRLIEEDA